VLENEISCPLCTHPIKPIGIIALAEQASRELGDVSIPQVGSSKCLAVNTSTSAFLSPFSGVCEWYAGTKTHAKYDLSFKVQLYFSAIVECYQCRGAEVLWQLFPSLSTTWVSGPWARFSKPFTNKFSAFVSTLFPHCDFYSHIHTHSLSLTQTHTQNIHLHDSQTPTHTQTHTHIRTQSDTHSYTHTHTHTLSLSLSLSLSHLHTYTHTNLV